MSTFESTRKMKPDEEMCYDMGFAAGKKAAYDELKEYQDIGLTLNICAEYKKFEDELVHSGKTFQHVLDLLAAEKDGMCSVCLVKLHQHIFRIFNGKILNEIVCNAIFEPFTPRPRWKIYVMGSGTPYYWYEVIGKTVFRTYAEAEAALGRE